MGGLVSAEDHGAVGGPGEGKEDALHKHFYNIVFYKYLKLSETEGICYNYK